MACCIYQLRTLPAFSNVTGFKHQCCVLATHRGAQCGVNGGIDIPKIPLFRLPLTIMSDRSREQFSGDENQVFRHSSKSELEILN